MIRNTLTTVAAVTLLASSLHAVSVAYIHGDVAPNGNIPSGSSEPYDQMLLDDSSDTGMSTFKQMVEDEGYTIDQFYDGTTTLDAGFLDQFDTVIFGLHQKIWSASEKAALDAWLQAGGGALFYSDSAAGGAWYNVGAQNNVGQTAVNNVISAYGMEVLVDQADGTKAIKPGPTATHPVIVGDLIFEGEGVSPVAVDPNSGVEILIPYVNSPEYSVSGAPNIIHTQNLTISNPDYAALAYTQVGSGIVMVAFDRQPFWNNGIGSNIQKRDNFEILRRIVKFLSGDLGTSSELSVDAEASLLVTTSGSAHLEGTLTGDLAASTEWAVVAGPGSVTFVDSSAEDTFASFSAPGLYELSFTASNGTSTGSTSLIVEVINPDQIVHAINGGAGSLTATTGISYTADNYYDAGWADNFSGPVSGTLDDGLYTDARSGHTSYRLPVENGVYTIFLQLSETYFSGANQRVFDISLEGQLIIDDLDLVEVTGGRFSAYDQLFSVTITDGFVDLGFDASINNPLLNALVVVEEASGISGTPIPRIIEAEDYDNGGSGVAYFDTTAGNNGGAYKNDNVDIQNCSEGGFNVGWIAQGEYLVYSIDVAEAANYDVGFRVASQNNTAKSLHLEIDGINVTGSVTFNTNGDGWQNWRTVSAGPIYLEPGVYQARLVMDSAGFNVNYMEFSLSEAQPIVNVLGINAGGSEQGDYNADFGSDGGSTYATSTSIDLSGVSLPAPEALYQTERWSGGTLNYTIDQLTPGAYYTVRLHFAEIYHNQVGKRQFNVAINGQPVLTNYDIVSQSGGPNIAIVEEFPAVADALGNLAITLSKGSADNPKISGIELLTSD
jgi:hypothetical protein